MITDFLILIDHYHYLYLVRLYPWWTTALTIIIHFFALHAIYRMNNGETSKRMVKCSKNTLHSSLWAIIVLSLPFVGIVLYILLSVMPYRRWKNKNSDNNNFPMAFLLRKGQVAFIIIPGVICAILDTYFLNFEWNLSREIALLCWTLMVLADCFFSHYNQASFYRIKPSNEDDWTLVPCNDILGMKHFVEEGADKIPVFIFSDEAAVVRRAADNEYGEIDLILDKNSGTVSIGGKNYDYKRIMTQSDFNNNKYDAVDAVYLGMGITRYVFSIMKQDDDNTYFEDSIVYRAVPRFKFFIMRAIILFGIYIALFTSFFTTTAIKITSFIDTLVH